MSNIKSYVEYIIFRVVENLSRAKRSFYYKTPVNSLVQDGILLNSWAVFPKMDEEGGKTN